MPDTYPVVGFIVLEDGRAYAAPNWADATLRAISRKASDPALRAWLLAQQSEHVGYEQVAGMQVREPACRWWLVGRWLSLGEPLRQGALHDHRHGRSAADPYVRSVKGLLLLERLG
jgi:hypothetical protein